MSSVSDTVNALVVQTIAAINMTLDIFRFGGDCDSDKVNTVLTQSSSTDDLVRRSKQHKRLLIDDWGGVSKWLLIFRFFFEDDTVQDNQQLRRGRSRKPRRQTSRLRTNAEKQVPGHIIDSETQQTLPQKVAVTHDDITMGEECLEPKRIEKRKKQLFRPAVLCMKPDWLRKRCKGLQRDPVYLIESVDTFEMFQELAAMKKQQHSASWQICPSPA